MCVCTSIQPVCRLIDHTQLLQKNISYVVMLCDMYQLHHTQPVAMNSSCSPSPLFLHLFTCISSIDSHPPHPSSHIIPLLSSHPPFHHHHTPLHLPSHTLNLPSLTPLHLQSLYPPSHTLLLDHPTLPLPFSLQTSTHPPCHPSHLSLHITPHSSITFLSHILSSTPTLPSKLLPTLPSRYSPSSPCLSILLAVSPFFCDTAAL